jgi:hypothetical protein
VVGPPDTTGQAGRRRDLPRRPRHGVRRLR